MGNLTISFLNSVSLRLQRAVSLFPPLSEFSCSFNWECFLSFFSLLIFFLFCEFREMSYCSLGGLFICRSVPLYFAVACYLFLAWEFGYLLSLSCEQTVIPLIGGCVCFQEKEVMGRASSQCLVAGLLTVAMIFRKLAQATASCRALGSGNEPWAELDTAQNI